MAKGALEIKNLTKSYGKNRGITNVSLTVEQGEVFGFLGPNGAGKSTTIKTVMNIIKPTSGSVAIFGLDAQMHYKEAHRQIGYLAGDMELDPGLTGRQFLAYAAGLRELQDLSSQHSLAKRLQADLTKKIRHLSRGNKQKIGLIAALMHDPDLLILDEPTSGLDPLMQAEFNKIIREHTARGKTVFISSHILSEVQTICDRVAFIRAGKLIETRSLDELVETSTRKVRLSLVDWAKPNIAGLAGATNIVNLDGQTTFEFSGNLNDLTKWAAKLKLQSLEISEIDLDDLFMQYYHDEEASDV